LFPFQSPIHDVSVNVVYRNYAGNADGFLLAEVLKKTPATQAGERKRFDYLERVNFRYSNYFIHFKPEVKRKVYLIRAKCDCGKSAAHQNFTG